MTTSSNNTNIAQQHANINPSEVGWQFVPQYYNFVNKEPHRLHCFYTKESTLIHGTEGEQDKPCFGQQEIHNKITAIGFQECRVFIHSVDAQSSANGGIIIQVIGEMSNHNEPWRKFVQTFFLAEQPNGYFVLNDIFRYLKEETFESDDASESAGADTTSAEWSQQQQQTSATPATTAAPEPVVAAPAPVAEPAVVEPPREPTPPPAAPVVEPTPVPAAPADEAPTTDVTEPAAPAAVEPTKPATPAPPTPVVAPAQLNGVHEEKPKSVAPSPAPVPNVNLPPTTATPAAAPAAEKPSAPAVSAAPSTAPQPPAAAAAPQQAPAPPAAPQPTQPPAPKTWASLAASNKGKWGSAVAQDSRGTTEVLSSSSPAPSSGQQTPVAPHGHARGGKPQGGEHHPLYVAATQVTTAQCFIKGVTEAVTEPLLAAALSKFGALKGKPDVVHSKVCAFVEFASVESAKRAIISSLNTSAGGDGGVWIDVSSNPNAGAAGGATDASRPGQIRVFVETKKERGDRPVNRRGGAPQGGQQQGGQQGQVNGDGHHRTASGFRGGRGQGRGRGGKA